MKSSHQEDEFDIVGKNVAAKLRRMTKDMQLIAEKLIYDTLFKGLSGELNKNMELKDSTQVPFTYATPIGSFPVSTQNDNLQGQQGNIMAYL